MSDDVIARLKPFFREDLEELAGSLLPRLFSSREEAGRHLEHPDPSVRLAALKVLTLYWRVKRDDALGDRFEGMGIHDPDLVVRACALGALADCYAKTDDVRIGRLLASVVRDEAATQGMRLFAYRGLYTVRGSFFDPGPTMEVPRIPEDINWDFVGSFLVEGRSPSPRNLWEEVAALAPPRSPAQMEAVRLAKLADEAYKRGDRDLAIKYVAEILEREPECAELYCQRGCFYLQSGKHDEAVADLSKAIALRPYLAAAYRARSEAYEAMGLTAAAERDRRNAIQVEDPRAYLFRPPE